MLTGLESPLNAKMSPWGDPEQIKRRERDRQRRSERLAEARKKGRHSQLEWLVMKHLFKVCAACRDSSRPVEKDHITPISCGGSDAIDNLQPLCARCNIQNWYRHKDCREEAMPGWRAEFDRRLQIVME
jgi:5-methylcytosine-specific restriction endonuclease McrA